MRFGDFPEEYTRYHSSRVALLPVPFDKTCSYLRGASQGPRAIVEASTYLEWYDIVSDYEVYREGIYTCDPVGGLTPEEMVEATYNRARHLIGDGKYVVTLGGEHSVSVGAAWAYADKYPGMEVLQLDAHTDTRDEYHGSRFSHACAIARISEKARKVTAVGIRSIDRSELANIDRSRTFFAHEIQTDPDWQDKVVESINAPVYVTIDIDVFDPSIIPATGTPEPGGLDWYEVTGLLLKLARNKKIVGFDLVELSPHGNHASEFTAAKLVYTFLSYIAANKAWDI